MNVSAQFLLEGAWYSLEQSGLLLADAVDRFRRARHGTAVALALLAREELGKARLLLGAFREVSQGSPMTLKELRSQLRNHPAKQAAALLSIGITAAPGTPLADLMHKAFTDIGSPESVEAMRAFGEILDKRKEDLPQERRALREQGIYVDPSDDGTTWERPREFSGTLAEQEIYGALNDYSSLRASLTGSEEYAAVRLTLESWPERPELPQPPWPE